MSPGSSPTWWGNVATARQRARRVLPRVVFDYVDGAADDELTMAANVDAWRSLDFAPRMANGAAEPDLATAVLGRPVALPVVLAPCGLVRLLHPDGAVGVAAAAATRGTISVLSTVAGSSPEEVAAGAPVAGRWFQLYAPGGRQEAAELARRAAAAGYEALMVTVDTPALGNRERDLRNGVVPPLRLDARTAIALGPQVLARPRWALRMARTGVSMLGRPRHGGQGPAAPGDQGPAVPRGPGDGSGTYRPTDAPMARSAAPATGLAAAGAVAMLASPFSWDDIAWLRDRWTGPLVVKGVLGAEDGRRAADAGADAVVVSNHGGRQLDGAPATAAVLPEVVDAVGERAEVLVDGGIRRGSDVARALALGATAVLIGRPYLYGLAVDGQRGVEAIVDVLATELRRTLRLLGCPSVRALDRSWLRTGTARPPR
jgi:L-lactate dehydrogenase (cytochrome)